MAVVKDLSKISRVERAEYVVQLQEAKREVEAAIMMRRRRIRKEQLEIDNAERRLRDIESSLNHLM
ncbi:hypothetical protein [Rhodococcus sp. ACS1]|uniref:hypothetical protein n=1 Tax=Rhodococcus sp. ACS1 TaxID=2028570 RepID=UPI00117AF946|nr:hypothetical protein [Rhodococcus sp. ACS1]